MIESIKHVKDLIFDSSKSWGIITARLISLFALLIILDLSFNFTYNLHTSNKLSQLEKITLLKTEYKTDPTKTAEIKRIEKEVFSKEHYSEFLPRFFSKIYLSQITEDQITENITSNSSSKSLFWMAFSSNYLFAIILPVLIFMPLFSRSSRNANGITGWISSLVMIGGMVTLITWISYQIPLIWNNPIWNYILNFIIHTIFLVLASKYNKTKN